MRHTITERYERTAQALLRRHKITWGDASRHWAVAHLDLRRVECQRPRDAYAFYVFCHEVAHIVLDHRTMGAFQGMADEIEADVWAVKRLRKLRGWLPQRVRWALGRRGAELARRALFSGRPMPDCLDALAAQMKGR